MFRLLRCRTTRPFLARVVALLLAAPLFFYLFVFDLPDVAPRERTVVLPAPGNDARSLVERRWAAFLSCVEETPCPAQAKIMRSPPSYSAAKEHFLEMYAATASLRNVSAHGYGGFGGPWLENLFVEAADKYAMALFERFYPVIPLIMQSTDICVQHHHLRDPIKRLLRTGLRPEFIYAFASQHDNGLCSWEGGEGIPLDPCTSVPPNLLHFSAGGYGNIPIPLVMGDRTDRAPGPRPEASTAVLFSGSMDTNPSGLRIRATSHLRNLSAAWGFPGETFYRFFYGPTFEEELPRALLVASPRGWGRSSFRSSELIQMGLAQLYIWDDTPWLPYWHPDPSRRRGRQEFWGPNGIGLALHVDSLGDLRRVLCAMLTPEGGESPCAPDPGIGADGQPPPAPFLKAPYAVGPTTLLARMRARAAAFAPSHFTYKGVMDRITEFMVTPWDADLVCRPYPRSRNNF